MIIYIRIKYLFNYFNINLNYILLNIKYIIMINEKKNIIIILPGSSYHTLKNTYKNLENNYNLILLGHSCLGCGYDRYPLFWDKGTSGFNLIDMTTNDKIFNPRTLETEPGIEKFIKKILETKRIHCIICGSRGGQVVLPTLWTLGIDIPTVILNAGCINSPCLNKLPDSRIVLSTFGKDYFPTKNPQISINAVLNNKFPKGTILAHSYFEGHRPKDNYLKNLLPNLVKAAINDDINDLNMFFCDNNLGFAINLN